MAAADIAQLTTSIDFALAIVHVPGLSEVWSLSRSICARVRQVSRPRPLPCVSATLTLYHRTFQSSANRKQLMEVVETVAEYLVLLADLAEPDLGPLGVAVDRFKRFVLAPQLEGRRLTISRGPFKILDLVSREIHKNWGMRLFNQDRRNRS